jgi:hypothetical protein
LAHRQKSLSSKARSKFYSLLASLSQQTLYVPWHNLFAEVVKRSDIPISFLRAAQREDDWFHIQDGLLEQLAAHPEATSKELLAVLAKAEATYHRGSVNSLIKGFERRPGLTEKVLKALEKSNEIEAQHLAKRYRREKPVVPEDSLAARCWKAMIRLARKGLRHGD